MINLRFLKPLRRLDSVYFRASGGTTFHVAKTGVPPFMLGGPLQLSAYGTNEMFTNQCMLFQLGYLRQIGQLPPILGNKVYFSTLYGVARPYKTQNLSLNGFSDLPMDVAAGMLVETLFGLSTSVAAAATQATGRYSSSWGGSFRRLGYEHSYPSLEPFVNLLCKPSVADFQWPHKPGCQGKSQGFRA
jgi:hypothetical protein